MGEEKDRCIRGSGSRRWACRGARRCFGRRVSSWKELLWLELVTNLGIKKGSPYIENRGWGGTDWAQQRSVRNGAELEVRCVDGDEAGLELDDPVGLGAHAAAKALVTGI